MNLVRAILFSACVAVFVACVSSNLRAQDYALRFQHTGGYDYVQTGKWISGIHNDWTMEVWFYPEQNPVDNFGNLVVHRANWEDKVIRQESVGEILMEEVYYNNARVQYSTPVATLDQWHHAALVSTATHLHFYLDGDSLFSGAKSFGNSDWDNAYMNSFIGGQPTDHNGDGFTGVIDEVRIWDRTLSGDEIRSTMHSVLRGDEPGLVAYYPFRDGTGQVATDLSANANHGQLGSDAGVDEHDPTWVVSNAPVYDYTSEWSATEGLLPEEVCPPWRLGTDPDLPAPVLTGEYIEIATTEADPVMYYDQWSPLMLPTDSVTIEARMRFVTGGGTPSAVHAQIAFVLQPSTGNRFWIGQDSVYLQVQGGPPVTADVDTDDDFHTYRLEIQNLGPIQVYQDDSLVLTGATYLDASDFPDFVRIYWGDGTSFGWGTSYWQYVRHTARLAPLVTNLNDGGAGSLRAVIEQANASAGSDTITFCVAGEINLLSPLPTLSDATGGTFINGLSAPGASWGNPTITIDGANLSSSSGFEITSDNNEIEGLTIREFPDDGITITGPVAGNRLSSNLFRRNHDLSIDLGGDGITPNDPGDGDTGPNTLLNYPVFDSIRELQTDLFTVFGTAAANATVELYMATEYGHPTFVPEPVKHGPAYELLGVDTSDGTGLFEIDSIARPEWSRITATATDAAGNTSELSRDKTLSADPLRVTAYYDQIEIRVYGPPDSTLDIDSIGPTFNTFGDLASYTVDDFNDNDTLDVRVTIASPDTGLYAVKFKLASVGEPGTYLTGIGIDGHLEAQQTLTFAAPDAEYDTTHYHGPGVTNRGDLDRDGFITALDLGIEIDILFAGHAPADPPELADLDCDGFPTALDLAYLIDYLFAGGRMPCLK